MNNAIGVIRANTHRNVEQTIVDGHCSFFSRDIGRRTVDIDSPALLDPRGDHRDIGIVVSSSNRCAIFNSDDRRGVGCAEEIDVERGVADIGRVRRASGQQQTANVEDSIRSDDKPARRIEPDIAAGCRAAQDR